MLAGGNRLAGEADDLAVATHWRIAIDRAARDLVARGDRAMVAHGNSHVVGRVENNKLAHEGDIFGVRPPRKAKLRSRSALAISLDHCADIDARFQPRRQ